MYKCVCIVEYIFLQNVRTFYGNSEPQCTYYEQYCIDNDYFRLGEGERDRV
jgi:hypothetical protein